MNNLSSSVNSLEWCRNKVSELSSQGYNQSEKSRILQISQPAINRDLSYLRQQATTNIKKYIDERLPEEYEKCLVGLTAITKEAWNTSQQTEDKRQKIQALDPGTNEPYDCPVRRDQPQQGQIQQPQQQIKALFAM
jgi:predicted transcriptional regulator